MEGGGDFKGNSLLTDLFVSLLGIQAPGEQGFAFLFTPAFLMPKTAAGTRKALSNNLLNEVLRNP